MVNNLLPEWNGKHKMSKGIKWYSLYNTKVLSATCSFEVGYREKTQFLKIFENFFSLKFQFSVIISAFLTPNCQRIPFCEVKYVSICPLHLQVKEESKCQSNLSGRKFKLFSAVILNSELVAVLKMKVLIIISNQSCYSPYFHAKVFFWACRKVICTITFNYSLIIYEIT